MPDKSVHVPEDKKGFGKEYVPPPLFVLKIMMPDDPHDKYTRNEEIYMPHLVNVDFRKGMRHERP